MAERSLHRDWFARVVVVLGVLGFAGAVLFHTQAFPIASIDFQVSRAAAEQQAVEYLHGRGYTVEDYLRAVSFQTDNDAKNYLERKAGLAELNRLAHDELSIWYWRIRFFRPLQKEEFRVRIDPTGRITAFQHEVAEDAPGADLTAADARVLAERFLREDKQVDLQRYRLVDSSAEKRPHRTDHYFTWEREGFKVAEATARIVVEVQGEEIGRFVEFVKLPEDWVREQREEFNRGLTLANVGWGLYAVIILAMLVVGLRAVQESQARWRFGLAFATIVFVVGLLAGLNNIPTILINYQTASELESYLIQWVTGTLVSQMVIGLMALVSAVAGVALVRRVAPHLPPPATQFSWRGLCAGSTVRGLLFGYAIAGMTLGYIVLFYWIGVRFLGVWAPVELPYDDILSTYLPLVYPLTVGASAAITEEFSFRLFAVPLFLALTLRLVGRPTPSPLPSPRGRGSVRVLIAIGLALLLPAAIWASLHSTYPQQPFYIRAIELTIGGFVTGVIFLRYGVLPTVVSHYTFNATAVGALLLLTGNLYFIASAVVVISLPLIFLAPAGLARLRGQPLLDDEALADEEPPAAPTVAPIEAPARPATVVHESPLSNRTLLAALGVGIVLAVVVTAIGVSRIGEGLRVATTSAAVQVIADQHLAKLGLKPADWTTATRFFDGIRHDGSDHQAATYLVRQLGAAEANRILETELPPFTWEVRYFHELQKEEYFFWLDPAHPERLRGFRHPIEEKAPGASKTREEAQRIAEAYLVEQGVDLNRLRLVEDATHQRDQRTDHLFTWERTDFAVGESGLRTTVGVAGDQVNEFSTFLKTPETFNRELERQSPLEVLLSALRTFLAIGIGIWLLALFALRFRDRAINFPFALRVAVVFAMVFVLAQVNGWADALESYPTTISVSNFLIMRLVSLGASFIGLTLAGLVLAGLTESLYRSVFLERAFGKTSVAGLLQGWRKSLEAVALAIAAIAFVYGLGRARSLVVEYLARETFRAEQIQPIGTLNSYLPALAPLAVAVLSGGLLLLAGLTVGLALYRVLGRPALVGLVGLVLALVLGVQVRSFAEAAISAGYLLVLVAAAYVFVTRLARHNLQAYLLAAWALALAEPAFFLTVQPEPFYRANGVIVAVALVAPFLLSLAFSGQQSVVRAPGAEGKSVQK